MCGCARMQADANRMSGYGLGAGRSRGVRSDDVKGVDMSKTGDVSVFGVRGCGSSMSDVRVTHGA